MYLFVCLFSIGGAGILISTVGLKLFLFCLALGRNTYLIDFMMKNEAQNMFSIPSDGGSSSNNNAYNGFYRILTLIYQNNVTELTKISTIQLSTKILISFQYYDKMKNKF